MEEALTSLRVLKGYCVTLFQTCKGDLSLEETKHHKPVNLLALSSRGAEVCNTRGFLFTCQIFYYVQEIGL